MSTGIEHLLWWAQVLLCLGEVGSSQCTFVSWYPVQSSVMSSCSLCHPWSEHGGVSCQSSTLNTAGEHPLESGTASQFLVAELCVTAAQGRQRFSWVASCCPPLPNHPASYRACWSYPFHSSKLGRSPLTCLLSFLSLCHPQMKALHLEKRPLIRWCLCKFREGWIKATQAVFVWHLQTPRAL